MSEESYITCTEKEKQILEQAREQRFGEGRRVAIGCFCRLLAEESLESEEGP